MDIKTPMCYYINALRILSHSDVLRIYGVCPQKFYRNNKDLSEKIGVDYEGSQTLALL